MQGKDHLRIENIPFMTLTIEKLAHGVKLPNYNKGTIYSLAHYHIWNGDLMSDPEMRFVVITEEGSSHSNRNVQIIPCSFEQSDMVIYEESIIFNDQQGVEYNATLQNEHVEFAELWLANIKDQGYL